MLLYEDTDFYINYRCYPWWCPKSEESQMIADLKKVMNENNKSKAAAETS